MTLLLLLSLSLFSQDRRFRALELTTGIERLEPALASALNRSADSEALRVIVQFSESEDVAGRMQSAVVGGEGAEEQARAADARLEAIYSSGATLEKTYGSLPVAAVVADRSALKRLAEDSRVERISLDHPIRASLATTARAIGADQVWTAAGTRPGFTGNGVTVAVIDSGDDDSADLNPAYLARVYIASGEHKDKYGHGTHIAGIIAGRGVSSGTGKGFSDQYKGIAPGAKLISLKALDRWGSGWTSDVLAALDWCLKNKNQYNIRVINLSLGHPVLESYKTDPLCRMAEACVRAGIVVVAAAGNYGKDESGNAIYGGVTSPANDPAVITVGAVNTYQTAARSDDSVASYSSRGPTAIDGRIKPDLVAPGNKVVSDADNTTLLYKNNP